MRRRRRDSPTTAAPPPSPSPPPLILHPERRVLSAARPTPDAHNNPPLPPPSPAPSSPDLQKPPSLESTSMGKSRRPAPSEASRSARSPSSAAPLPGQPANAPATAPAPAPPTPGNDAEFASSIDDAMPESLPSSHASADGGGAPPKPKSRKRKQIISVSWGVKGKRGRGEKGPSLKFDIQQLPHDMDAMLLKKDVKCEMEKDGLMPKLEAKVFSPAPEDSVPSSFGSNLIVSLDDKAGEISEISEHKTGTEKVACCSQKDGLMPKIEAKVFSPAPEDSVPSSLGSNLVVSLDDKAGEVGEISEHKTGTEKMACCSQKDGLMPKIEAEVFSPAPEDSVPSSFGSNLVVSLDDKAGQTSEISEHKIGTEKVACCSLGEGMLSFDSGSWKEEALGDEIQFSRMDGCLENGGLGHQDSSGVELGCPNHLALELNACKSVVDKPRSVVFVENVKEEELENQKPESSSVSRRRNPRRSASAKNPTIEKHDQIYKGNNSTCKSKKVNSSCSLVESNLIKVLNKTTKVSMHEHDGMKGPSVTGKQKTNALDKVKSPSRKKNGHSGRKNKMQDPYVKGQSMSKNIAGDIIFVSGLSTSHSQLVDLAASHTNEHSSPATEVSFEKSPVVSTGIPVNSACITDGASVSQPPRVAWVCCDDCEKWRCIPADLADNIGKYNCRWTCKDNQDKTFAACSIPQEKTNTEINAELDLSDASADEADNNGLNSKASKAPSWTHARVNSFPHRNRRNQSIDESMVCNCKPPQDGRMGCRDGCLNRMLNIECEKRTCPCGEQCSNQQFQRRSYAKISWFHSGKKGYGLELQEEVSEGRFLIEYVGEVLDITAYESRQSYYASKGQKHFYFMALNGGEVIDACTKGNLGRFINHSCSPNCRTEKWMVNGEVCIGIFAMRKIKKGEELTFDYNYVRVSGAAPQKCFCGTNKCWGYIGGDVSGSVIISQDNAEAEHFEPMVTYKDAEEMLGSTYCSDGTNQNIVQHETSIQQEDSNICPPATPDSEPYQQTSPILSDTSEPNNSMEAWSPQDAEDVTRTPVHVSQTIESPLQQNPVHGTQPLEFLEKTPTTIVVFTAPDVVNRSTPSSDLGSSLVPGFHMKKKNSLKHHRNVKPPCPIGNEHTPGVEGRLNSLLDKDGGISKRKDSTNEYLRLLLVTAADGDAGGTSKSIRDLALILEALLQTKSGAVLLDIINMNGLQMLHNILKQNRDHFIRRPIVRKLLKVLEFLALRGILTAEKINESPRRAGMESFRDSMLKLTRHGDKHVHLIARKFCDKWILPYMNGHSYSSGRKRKSRWDYQPESHYKMADLQIAKVYSGHGELDLETSSMKNNRSHGNWLTNSNHNDVSIIGSSTDGDVPPGFEPPQQERGQPAQACLLSDGDDAPPGFEPPQQERRQPAQACLLSDGDGDDAPPGFEPKQACLLSGRVAPGFCQGRYLPNLSVSYGIPVAIVQHLGTPDAEGTQKWKVAPGVPFNPFPPSPAYPLGNPCPSSSSTPASHRDGASSTMERKSSGCRGRGGDRDGRVDGSWRNGTRTRLQYDHEGRRVPSNHHRLEK